jgi:hypothetical protein
MNDAKDLDVVIAELLTVDWVSRFESFAARELRILNGFNEFGWRLGNRSFFASPSRLHVGDETHLNHAGTEALELAGVTLRQSWQPKDLVNHERVIKLLRERAADGVDQPGTLAFLDDLDRRFASALGEPMMTFVDADDLAAGRWPKVIEHVTAADVLDNWLHSGVIHLDLKKAAAMKVWSSTQYEWSALKATTRIARVVLATHVVVRGALGVLDQDRRVTSGPGVTATTTGPP